MRACYRWSARRHVGVVMSRRGKLGVVVVGIFVARRRRRPPVLVVGGRTNATKTAAKNRPRFRPHALQSTTLTSTTSRPFAYIYTTKPHPQPFARAFPLQKPANLMLASSIPQSQLVPGRPAPASSRMAVAHAGTSRNAAAAVSGEALRARLLELVSRERAGARSACSTPAPAAAQSDFASTDSDDVPSACDTLCIVSWDEDEADE